MKTAWVRRGYRVLGGLFVGLLAGTVWGDEIGTDATVERIFEQIEAAEYHFVADSDGDWSAPNRAVHLRTRVSSTGLAVTPRLDTEEDPFEFSLELTHWGREGRMVEARTASLYSDESAIRLDRAEVVEWLVNDGKGVEHGFDIAVPPPGDGPLRLRLRLRTSGLLAYAAGERSLVLRDSAGRDRLRYRDLVVIDTTGAELPARMELGPERLDLVVDDGDAVYPIVVDPLITSAGWSYDGTGSGSLLGRKVYTAGDVNGDGFSDILVAAPYEAVGPNAVAGEVYLFLGSASGPQSTPAWTLSGQSFLGELGGGVATAGDVNGDGFDDVIIGEPGYTNGLDSEGRVMVFHGSAASPPLGTTPDWSFESNNEFARLGEAVTYAGDVNGDHYADILVGAPGYSNGQSFEGRVWIFRGGPSGLAGTAVFSVEGSWTGASLGASVATAGDVNGDGLDDVILGAPDHSIVGPSAGRVFLYRGTSTGMAFLGLYDGTGQQAARFGFSVSTAGDVNGDGYADVIIGEPGYDSGPLNVGRAVVVLGSASGLESQEHRVYTGTQQAGGLGSVVATAGDVDGDGYADIAIGEPGYSGGQSFEGRVKVYLGSSSGVGALYGTVEPDESGAEFGSSLSTAGDADGDGRSDLLVGAQSVASSSGRAYWFASNGEGLRGSGGFQSNAAGAKLGFSLDGGDLNGDGYSDLVVGAPYFDAGGTDNGTALIYFGAAGGLNTSPGWQTNGGSGDEHGFDVAVVGDINGDGYEDLVVGEPGDAADTGRAVGYLGGPSGPGTTVDFSAGGGAHALARSGEAVAGIGDVNGDGLADVAVGAPGHSDNTGDQFREGQVQVGLGRPGGFLTFGGWPEGDSAEAAFGAAVDGVGDVNRDGYSDFIVGAPGYAGVAADAGAAYLFFGGPAGPYETAGWSREPGQAGARYGTAVAGIGDFNNDSYSDFVVSSPFFDEGQVDEGAVNVYSGTATNPAFRNYIVGNVTDARIGEQVAGAGDVNNDGYSDFAIGTPHGNRLTIWHGSGSWSFPGPSYSDSSLFAFSAAIAHGDWNGDGYGDLAVGAPDWTDTVGLEEEGAVWLFYGNDGRRGIPLRPRQMFADFAQPVALLGEAGDTDEFGVEGDGTTPAGSGRVRMEIEARRIVSGFTRRPTHVTNWQDTTFANPAADLATAVDGLVASQPYKWRMRIHRANPLFPHSPWATLAGNAATETDIQLRCTTTSWWFDMDGDGYGDGQDQLFACEAPAGYVGNNLDCDDELAAINPGAVRIDCDGLDNDCSGSPDAPDVDGDGFDICDFGDVNNPDLAGIDCDPGNDEAWALPTDVTLTMSHSGGVGGVTTLSWTAPADPGGVLRGYDVLRAVNPDWFDDPDCLESGDTDLTATEPSGIEPVGFYLVVSINDCGRQAGTESQGQERTISFCP